MRTVKIGVIGCGVIGRTHIKSCANSPLFELVAVADRIEERSAEMAGKYGVSKVYKEGIDLIRDPEIEAVVLAFPAEERGRLAIKALESGKHVLVEKPVALNTGEILSMLEVRGSLTAGCCSSRYRHFESSKEITKFIASGELGQLREVHCRVLVGAAKPPVNPPPPWRQSKKMNGGGILVNWGCYDLDFLLGITGWSLKPRLVLAQTWKTAPQFSAYIDPASDADSHYSAFIRCGDGTVITLERAEFAAVKSESSWQIVGTNGSLRMHMTWQDDKEIYFDTTEPQTGVVSKVIWKGSDKIELTHDAPALDFAQAILDKRQPETSLEKALIMQKITDAIYRSAGEGICVEIGE